MYRQIVTPEVRGDTLLVVVHKDFDKGMAHQDWVPRLLADFPGPYATLIVDCGQCGLLSSTFFAGLAQLHQDYSARGTARFVLRHPDPRVERNLRILRLHTLYSVEPRP